jgi:hypothetical protein
MRLRTFSLAAALGAALALAGCGSGDTPTSATDNSTTVAEDPYGATGAPGADLTDNGANDGASGMADGNQGESANLH